MNGSIEDNFSDQERVLNALRELPDEKLSSSPICHHTIQMYDSYEGDPSDFNRAIQELIVLGEVELCQERGTGGRVWLKRRDSPGNQPDDGLTRQPESSVWRGYTTTNYDKKIADRLFTSKEEAMKHLGDSAVCDPQKYEEVPYREDVWYQERGRTVAVVRCEPVYSVAERDR